MHIWHVFSLWNFNWRNILNFLPRHISYLDWPITKHLLFSDHHYLFWFGRESSDHFVCVFPNRKYIICLCLKRVPTCLTFEYNILVASYLRSWLPLRYWHLSRIRICCGLGNYLNLLWRGSNLIKQFPACSSFRYSRSGECLGIFYCVFIYWEWTCEPVSFICYTILSQAMTHQGS